VRQETVAAEFGAEGIRANSVHPGYIETPMTKEFGFTVDHPAITPLRCGAPHDLKR
jgi:NAD(P)-dependent dehydrogenase (short-subunit alcohol dehydrogenase family)